MLKICVPFSGNTTQPVMKKFNAFTQYRYLIALLLVGTVFLKGCNTTKVDPDKEEWISLFDGSSFDTWVPKFEGSELGVNYKNRFVLKDSLLSVRYAENDTFNNDFGHLYYKDKFSYYRLKVTYRFVGEQQRGGPNGPGATTD